jgi:hypothetical protein
VLAELERDAGGAIAILRAGRIDRGPVQVTRRSPGSDARTNHEAMARFAGRGVQGEGRRGRCPSDGPIPIQRPLTNGERQMCRCDGATKRLLECLGQSVECR